MQGSVLHDKHNCIQSADYSNISLQVNKLITFPAAFAAFSTATFEPTFNASPCRIVLDQMVWSPLALASNIYCLLEVIQET